MKYRNNAQKGNPIINKLKDYSHIFLFGMFSLFAISLIGNVIQIQRGKERLEKTREEIANLESEQEKLLQEIGYVESEVYFETQIRDSLGLSKEGEIVVVLPDEEILRLLAPKIHEEPEFLPKENWEKWRDLFF